MEQFLKYFYNIYISNINKKGDNYYFYKDNSLFYLVKNYRSDDELKDIYFVTIELLENNIPVSQLIINNYGNIKSPYNNDNYILLKINCNTLADISLIDIININEKLFLNNDKKVLYRNNWANLWGNKVDYFEYQIKELGRSKTIILNSFSYYVGLAENAISLANIAGLNNNNQVGKIVLSHRRINYPNMEIDYYNPLNFIFDIQVRDSAEYFKSMFFYTDLDKTMKEFKIYLNKTNLNSYEANMLYARLLYPSYYFDIYEKVIENLQDETELLNIINKVTEYEEFLKQTYFELSKRYPIEQIKWIINKKEL